MLIDENPDARNKLLSANSIYLIFSYLQTDVFDIPNYKLWIRILEEKSIP